MQQTNISIGPILFLCYEGSLVSSNLNSKQIRSHGAHPNVDAFEILEDFFRSLLAAKILRILNIITIEFQRTA